MLSHRPGTKSLRRGRVSLSGQLYHITSRTLPSSQPFSAHENAFAACRAVHQFFTDSDSDCYAWVLMPDHAHWLVSLSGDDSLSMLVAALKKAIATSVNVARDTAGARVWQTGFYDRAIRSDEDVADVARYIVANPIRAGLVKSVREYSWWDAVWL